MRLQSQEKKITYSCIVDSRLNKVSGQTWCAKYNSLWFKYGFYFGEVSNEICNKQYILQIFKLAKNNPRERTQFSYTFFKDQ